MDIPQIIAAVPDYPYFFDPDEMARRTSQLLATCPDRVTRTKLGTSRFGADIDLLSVGQGSCTILVVGAPHPHELVGAMTADFLLTLFCEKPSLLASTNATWHFIKMIDPDGVRLNAGWLGKPLSLSDYFSSFFRPPLWRQAEFTFPFASGDHRFTGITPENEAWQQALNLTRPDILYSTHNCEFGRVFYFTSDGVPALDTALTDLTRRYQLTEDTTGEMGASPKPGLPGIFAFPDEVVESIKDMCNDQHPASMRTGDSSEGYSRKQYGSFSLVAEVPYWFLKKGEQDINVAEVLRVTRALTAHGEQLVDRYLPCLQQLTSQDAVLLLEALVVPRHDHGAQQERGVDNCHLALTDLLLAMRRPAMLFKVADIALRVEQLPGAEEIFCEVEQFHRQSLKVIEAMDFLQPVPIRRLVQLQTEAALLALKHVQVEHSAGHCGP